MKKKMCFLHDHPEEDPSFCSLLPEEKEEFLEFDPNDVISGKEIRLPHQE
jgi:hypothetical protein